MAVTRDTERKTAKSRVREVSNKIQGLTMTLDRTRAKLKVRRFPPLLRAGGTTTKPSSPSVQASDRSSD
jgi:hypothetical protein